MKAQYFQQGDVLFHHISEIPPGARKKVVDPVIQHGEATGHAHRIALFRHGEEHVSAGVPESVSMNWSIQIDERTGRRFLSVKDKPIEVRHEEHKPVEIPPGNYEIGIVQEYDHFAEEARQVAD